VRRIQKVRRISNSTSNPEPLKKQCILGKISIHPSISVPYAIVAIDQLITDVLVDLPFPMPQQLQPASRA